MGFKIFVDGDVLEAAEVNDYLMEQAVIACTAATRPGSPNDGMMVVETDTDLVSFYMGAAWATGLTLAGWTDFPSGSVNWTSAGTAPALGNGTVTAQYARWGRKIEYTGAIVMGSTTTFGSSNAWTITLPVTAKSALGVTGVGLCVDDTGVDHPAGIRGATTTTVTFATPIGTVNVANPFTWATSDELRWSITYEAAA